MSTTGKDGLSDLTRGATGLLQPAEDALRRPLGIGVVAFGHVLGLGAAAVLMGHPRVAGDPLSPEEDLDGLAAGTRVNLALEEAEGHAIEAVLDGDMVVHVHPGVGPEPSS